MPLGVAVPRVDFLSYRRPAMAPSPDASGAGRPDRARHCSCKNEAATSGSSHSHTQTTNHPANCSSARCRSSRAVLAASLAAHQSPFAFGRVPWTGQECQKSPITKTATRARVNTTSGRVVPTRWCTRNRRPRACNSRRRAISGAVPVLRCRLICRWTSSLLAAGRAATPLVSGAALPW